MFKNIFTVCVLSFILTGCNADLSLQTGSSEISVPTSVPSVTPVGKIRQFDPAQDIGGIYSDNECSILRISNSTLTPGEAVQVIVIDATGHQQKILPAKIVGPSECTIRDASEFIIDRQPSTADVHQPNSYQIEFTERHENGVGFGFGIVNTANNAISNKGIAELPTVDGRLLHFRECFSQEGMHLTVWPGKPLTDKPIWHAYQHLLYDTKQNCSSTETASIAIAPS